MFRVLRLSAVTIVAALGLAAAGCGDDEAADQSSTTTTEQTAEVSPTQAVAAAVERADEEPPAAAPNVLGGNLDIQQTLDRLNQDLHLYFADTLEPTGARVAEPRIAAAGGSATCNGKPTTGNEVPTWCEDEGSVFAPAAGAERLRSDGGPVALFTVLAWAHAQSVGAQLGWHKGVAAGQYTQSQVAQAEFCLMVAWSRYKFMEGVYEASDEPIFNRVLDRPEFASVPAAAKRAGVSKSQFGSAGCVR